MGTERDELARAIYDGLHHEDSDVYADAIGGDLDDVIVDGRVDLLAVADMLLAAGYRKPRVVTTAEELDALPVGSVVLDDEGDPWHKQEDPDGSGAIWRVPGSLLLESIDLVGCYPTLTVLHEGAQP